MPAAAHFHFGGPKLRIRPMVGPPWGAYAPSVWRAAPPTGASPMNSFESRARPAQRLPAADHAETEASSRERNAPDVSSTPRMAAQRRRLQGLFGNPEPGPTPASASRLPAGLQAGIESVAGQALPPVRVHYGSSRPAQLQAHAFTQGSDIHLAPGQERHLPHEAWHVVQQLQGRVRPTLQGPAGTQINDDPALEHEADAMGARASAVGQRVGAGRSVGDGAGPTAGPGVVQGEFFEKSDDGSYVWHPENADGRYRRLAETRRYHSWYNPIGAFYGAYPVYTRSAVDRSGQPVTGGMAPQEDQVFQQVRQSIGGTAYESVLDCLEQRIIGHLGVAVLAQFYKGAHIVFADDGAVYHEVFRLARPVGKFRAPTWGERWRGTAVAETPDNLLPSTTSGEGLGARRPERRETSHYSQDALPQLGIDLPAPLSGHLLVGLVPNDPYRYGDSSGHTFVQTEMFGFKTFYDHYVGHGQGFFWNFVASHQSGLVGYCKYSEKSGTEIREQDNAHILQGRFVGQAPVQRKIAFDKGDPVLGVDTSDSVNGNGLRQVIHRIGTDTLVGTGAVTPAAAVLFSDAIVTNAVTNVVVRDAEGRVSADFEDPAADPKSVFELYRQRYRLLGTIEDWTRLESGRHHGMYLMLRKRIVAGEFAEVLKTLAQESDAGGLQAVATSLYGDLESKALGDPGRGFLEFLAKPSDDPAVVRVRRMFQPLVLRVLPEESLKDVVRGMKGPEARQPYGQHHGLAHDIGLTSVLNYLADSYIEGFAPKTTSFAAFAIRAPRRGMTRPLVTGGGGEVLADGWYMYIVDASLQMLYFPTNNYVQEDKAERSKVFAQYIPHTVLSGGDDVWAAGTFLVRDGNFALVDNGSGHYRPAQSSLNVVRGLLAGMGYPVDATHFVPFVDTVKVGTEARILPNLDGLEIGKVGKTWLTMDRPERSPEVEKMLKSTSLSSPKEPW